MIHWVRRVLLSVREKIDDHEKWGNFIHQYYDEFTVAFGRRPLGKGSRRNHIVGRWFVGTHIMGEEPGGCRA